MTLYTLDLTLKSMYIKVTASRHKAEKEFSPAEILSFSFSVGAKPPLFSEIVSENISILTCNAQIQTEISSTAHLQILEKNGCMLTIYVQRVQVCNSRPANL